MSNLMPVLRNLTIVCCVITFFFGCSDKQTDTPTKAKVVKQKITAKTDGGVKPTETAKTGSTAAQKDKKGLGANQGNTALALITYRPEGKLDPFVPLFRERKAEEKQVGAKGQVPSDKPRVKPRPKPEQVTPLEKMDVSQFKLVAILRLSEENKALVQDASGKGYILKEGTNIGIHSGLVTSITKGGVTVEEEEEDALSATDGMVTLRERKLVLQKPVGEI